MWTGNTKTEIEQKFKQTRIFYEFKCDECGQIEWRTAWQYSNWKHFKPKSTYCNNCRKIKGYGRKHGETINKSSTKLYRCWMNMKRRCCDKKSTSYYLYGGKGIKVCEEWLEFIKFKEWALLHGWENNLTIDRINSDKGYCPENCRFISLVENCRNTKSLKFKLTHQGKTLTIKEWADNLGLKYNRILRRLKNNRPIEEVLTKKNLIGHYMNGLRL